MKSRQKVTLIALGMAMAIGMSAQDGQLSQYDAAPMLLNPALTGMFEQGDFRMSSNVRSQWNSLSSSFLTTSFGYDIAMQDRYGFGTYHTNYNMAGIMNTVQAGGSAAYNVLGKGAKATLSGGVSLGLIYKKVNDQQLVWDAQYDDGYFDTDLPSGENIERAGRLMPDVSIGIAYRSMNVNKRVNPFGNFALFHVTTPDESILRTTKSDIPIRWSANAGARIEVTPDIFLVPMGLYWRQGADQMIQAGMMGEIGIPGSVYSGVAGVSYRLNDAIIAQVGLKHKNAMYRFSYDVNTSKLGQYTNKNGAYEFSVIYYGTHSGHDRRVQRKSF